MRIPACEPWFTPETIKPGRVHVDTVQDAGLTVCRMAHGSVEGRISRIRFEFLIGSPAGIEHAAETHELGLFTHDEMTRAFEAAGFRVEHDPEGITGRGLYLGRC